MPPRRRGDYALTAKQAEALRLFASGLTYREIGERMGGISLYAVADHLKQARKWTRAAVVAPDWRERLTRG